MATRIRDSTMDGFVLGVREEERESFLHSYVTPAPTTPLMDLIPFGRFHILLLIMCGLGWMQDNYWSRIVGDISETVFVKHFGMSDEYKGIPATCQFAGMCLGSFFWGWASDYYGRRFAFITTLFVGGIAGTVAAYSPHWVVFLIAMSFLGFGAGGNLAVDGAIFTEFLPAKRRGFMLVMLSTFWSLGSIVASVQDYFLLPYFNDERDPDHTIGWRIALAIPATLSVFIGVLRLCYIESPLYLIRKGRIMEAAENMTEISRWNKRPQHFDPTVIEMYAPNDDIPTSSTRISVIFADRKILISTLLVWFFWFTTNVGYTGFNLFLPDLIKAIFPKIEAKEALIQTLLYNIAGLPGSLLGAFMVESFLGRKWSMTSSCVVTAVSVLLFYYAGTWGASAYGIVVILCLVNFFAQIMYAAYYTYTPEMFPTPIRSTGMGVAAFMGKAASIATPFPVGVVMKEHPSWVIWSDFTFLLAGGIAMALLPIETRGKQLK